MNYSMFRRFSRIALVAFALALPAVSQAQTTYTITDLGALGGSGSYGTGVNNSGQVAGLVTNTPYPQEYAMRWTGGVAQPLGTRGGQYSYCTGINVHGQIAGFSYPSSNTSPHAVRWDGTTSIDLGTLGGTDSYGYGINDSGQVAGYSYFNNTPLYHAFRYDSTGMHDLGTLGGTDSVGVAINASGQVTGIISTAGNSAIHAARWTGTTITDLGTLGGANSTGLAINASGQVAGYSDTIVYGVSHAVRWTGTTINDLGTLGGTTSYGSGINSFGTVVGYTQLMNNSQCAFYAVGNTMYDLNTLLPPKSGWYLTNATAISDNGFITGQGYINGVSHAFLLSPVTASLSGYVALEGVASLNAISPAAPLGTFHIGFRNPGATSESFSADVTLTTTLHVIGGTFTIPNAPTGTYDISIKGAKNLRVVLPNQVIKGAATLPDVLLPAGDANNDNSVDSTDFGVLIGAFGGDSSVPGSGYDPTADFNFDGVVDSTDFGLLIGEFNNAGAP